jgi:heat shock protein HslJ
MIDKRRMVAGLLTAALLSTTLPALAFAQEETEADGPYAPEGLDWVLESYLLDGSMRDIASEAADLPAVTLRLEDGTANGTAGCNDYSGAYEIGDDTLSFTGELALTRMMCEEPVMALEQTYLALLPTVAGWAVDDYTLTLTDADGLEVLRYGEAVVELRGSDLAALDDALAELAAMVTSLEASNAALTETVAGIDGRLAAVEDNIGAVNVRGVRDRVAALEDEMTQVQEDIAGLRENDRNQGNRIGGQAARLDEVEASLADLEEQVGLHFDAFPLPSPEPQ